MAHVLEQEDRLNRTQPKCRDKNDVKWRVDATFKGIPSDKYDEFLDKVQSLARDENCECEIGIGEEDE